MPAPKSQAPSGLTHSLIWEAIDRLAQVCGLSPSGLARRAGLDATSFNPSKRIGRDGRPRWPSTESIAKILAATDTDMAAFIGIGGTHRLLPSLPLSAAVDGSRFDGNGRPAGERWEKLAFGAIEDPGAYILIVGDDTLRPLYRQGDHLVVSPAEPVRPGDRVLLARRGNPGQAASEEQVSEPVQVRELVRRTQRRVEVVSFDPGAPSEVMAASDVAWIARIVWASQ